MDYEKKYKEALERAKEIIECSKSDSKEVRMVLSFFPELAESEGERIRKEIIDFATKANNGVTSILANNYNFNKWIEVLEKRAEQKTAEWSEQDERKCNNIIALVEGKAIMRKDIKGLVNWLNSLKERVQHQNMWISVDKEVYIKEPILAQKKDKSDVWEGYTVIADHTLDPLVFERYINIENISTQSLWRPSDEQMDALNDVISSRDIKYDVLSELWKDLNKLKD